MLPAAPVGGAEKILPLSPGGGHAPINVRLSYLANQRSDPLLEFYDARSSATRYGQYVGSFHLSALRRRYPGVGLLLEGTVPEWSISGPNMDAVMDFADTQHAANLVAPVVRRRT